MIPARNRESCKPLEPDRLAAEARRALMAGDLAGAESLSRGLAQVAPRDPRPWSLLAEAALRRDRPEAAAAAAERAVLLGPRDPIALLTRAKCLAILGDRRGARTAATAGAALKPLGPEALDGLGTVFAMIGDHDRACDLFRRAVEVNPHDPALLFSLAAAERMAGRFADAERHCDRVVGLAPHLHRAHWLRADLRSQTADRNHVGVMEGLIARGVRPAAGEVLLRYALGKECEDLGEHGRAFAHVAAGAALHRRLGSYDVAADIAVLEALRAEPLPNAAAIERRGPVFVVGLPRAGTSLVERILASHSGFAALGETGLFPAIARRLDGEAAGSAYHEAITRLDPAEGRRVVDRTLANAALCGRILSSLPDAQIVFVDRRPMDLGWALLRTLFDGAAPYSYDQDELAAYLLAHRRLMRHWEESLPAGSFLRVAYESIVADPAGAVRGILDFLGAGCEDEALRLGGRPGPSTLASPAQLRGPIHADSVGRWQHHDAALAPLRVALARGIPEAELA
jgi:Flp pilus assembly protein TadD